MRKEKKSVKTTGRTAQKRKAMDDVTKDQTPKAKKDNSVKMETAENQVAFSFQIKYNMKENLLTEGINPIQGCHVFQNDLIPCYHTL